MPVSAMRFDPLAYCFRRKNKIRSSENTDVAGDDSQVLTLRIVDDDAGNACDGSQCLQILVLSLLINRSSGNVCLIVCRDFFISR